jgi:hypothetical protein
MGGLMLKQLNDYQNDSDDQQQMDQVAVQRREPHPTKISEQPQQHQNDNDEF